MKSLEGLTNFIGGAITSELSDGKSSREIAQYLIQSLFEEDNLVLPPKQDFDLRLKMFNDFFDWHSKQGFVSFKREDFKEWLDSL